MSSINPTRVKPAPNTTASFVIGNTYQRLPESKAKYNRKGSLKKIHDWVLYVDIVQGDHHLIERVEFGMDKSWEPRTFTSRYPIKITRSDGSKLLRFQTRQQSTGSIVANVKIVGSGGTVIQKDHSIGIKSRGRRNPVEHFVETGSISRPVKPLTLADENFGIELELSCSQGSSVDQVADSLRRSGCGVTVVEGYARAHDPVQGWKLVHDGSIVCSPDFPNCSKFELVSPILCGEPGLAEVSRVVRSLQDSVDLSINKSMGFHLHISVQGMPLSSLLKACQNFVKYEDVIDTFMPPSRRSGSTESDQYFKSNKQAVAATNLSRKQKIAACSTIEELGGLMNPTGRYYKLNLQNLVTGRQPTFEFRQHSGTTSFEKISAWVRFCMALVKNSAQMTEPLALKQSRSIEEQFDMLFDFVIKDRALRATFLARQAEVHQDDRTADACCDGCAHGEACLTAPR